MGADSPHCRHVCALIGSAGRGSDSDNHDAENPFWRKVQADVYRVIDCGTRAANSTDHPTPAAMGGTGGWGPGGPSHGGPPKGAVGHVILLTLVACAAGSCLTVAVLRVRRLRRLGGAPTLTPSTRVGVASVPRLTNTHADTMRTPLASAAAPVGQGSILPLAVPDAKDVAGAEMCAATQV